MAEAKTVPGIVRGPKPHFAADGRIYAPGQIVPDVPAEEVSDEDYHEKEITVQLAQPVVDGKGQLVTEATRKVKVKTVFRPVGSAPTVAGPLDTAEVATGQPDRLNVTDFLKKGVDEIVADITSGTVDDHLGAIEQAEIARKGPARQAVKEAIAARLAGIRR